MALDLSLSIYCVSCLLCGKVAHLFPGLATAPASHWTHTLPSSLGAVPAGHGLQSAAPEAATEPTGQGRHSLRFLAFGTVPAPHGRQRRPCSGM